MSPWTTAVSSVGRRGGGRRRLPVGSAGRVARAPAAPGPPGQGPDPPPAGRLRARRACNRPSAASSMAAAATSCPGTTAPWSSAPPSRSRASTSPCEAGAVGDLLDDARRLVPSLEEYELSRPPPGCAPDRPTTRPSWAPPASRAWSWPPATTATASCSPRSPPTRCVRLLETSGGRSGAGPLALRRLPPRPLPRIRQSGAAPGCHLGPGVGHPRARGPVPMTALGERRPVGGSGRRHRRRPRGRLVRRRPAGWPWPATETWSRRAVGRRPIGPTDTVEIVTAAAGG